MKNNLCFLFIRVILKKRGYEFDSNITNFVIASAAFRILYSVSLNFQSIYNVYMDS